MGNPALYIDSYKHYNVWETTVTLHPTIKAMPPLPFV
jgi:hypothetical protein